MSYAIVRPRYKTEIKLTRALIEEKSSCALYLTFLLAVVIHHVSCANSSSKITVYHFVKQGISLQTIYDILKCNDKFKTKNFLPKCGRLSKLSNKDIQALTKSVNSKTGISQRRFGVHQSTFSRTLKNKTTVKTYTRRSVPDNRSENQKKRAN